MDMYGVSTNYNDIFHVDDLLDFSNEDLFSSTTTTTNNHNSDYFYHYPPPPPLLDHNTTSTTYFSSNTSTTDINPYNSTTYNFTDDISVPSEDAAELEWLSKLVDDSFTDYPVNELSGNINLLGTDPASSSSSLVPGKARSKRSIRLPAAAYLSSWTTEPTPSTSSSSGSSSGTGRKCTHCQSEKTPQWRTGPMGSKTLCNACGVRYKSGRLVPEYRPAASPTFTLTHHSNSHRKVMELRRQKELLNKAQLMPMTTTTTTIN